MEKQYIIAEGELVNLLRYLETRPYKEVAQGIAMLSRLEEISLTHDGDGNKLPLSGEGKADESP